MPLNHTDTDITTLKINSFETLADYQAAYAQGLIDSNEISFIDESLQADWNQSDSTAPDYIKNKPVGLNPVSGTHDGTNWNTLTIGTVTKSIPSGGGGGGTGGSSTLSGLDDTAISSPSNGQVLTYNNSTSKWVNATPSGGSAVGTLNTNNTAAQTVNANESLGGTIKLHKVAKTGTYSDLIGTPTIPAVVSGTHDGTDWTTITIGSVTKAIPSGGGGGGGLTNYNFVHTSNTTVSTSTTTVTFAANQRGSAMLTISADLGLTIACNNGSDNYIWIKNTGSAEVDVTISGVTKNSTAVSNVYMPSDGITVPAGGLCEIGVIVNSDGAFITSRNDLSL